jgi:hypothetical protein
MCTSTQISTPPARLLVVPDSCSLWKVGDDLKMTDMKFSTYPIITQLAERDRSVFFIIDSQDPILAQCVLTVTVPVPYLSLSLSPSGQLVFPVPLAPEGRER